MRQKNEPADRQLTKAGLAHCDRVSLYRCNAILSDVKDKFQDSETVQITTGPDSSIAATTMYAGHYLRNVMDCNFTTRLNLLLCYCNFPF